MSLNICSKESLESLLNSDSDLNEEVVFERIDDWAEETISVSELNFNDTLIIESSSNKKWIFIECTISKILINFSEDLHPLEFQKLHIARCKIGEFQIMGLTKITDLDITHSDILSLEMSYNSEVSFFKLYNCYNVGKLKVKGIVDEFRFFNFPRRLSRDNKTLPARDYNDDTIGTVIIHLGRVNVVRMRELELDELILNYANDEGTISLNTIFTNYLHLESVSNGKAILDRVESNSSILIKSDLSNWEIRNCNFGEQGKIINSKLEFAYINNTRWPSQLGGTLMNQQFGYRQLRLLHEKHGDYRKQYQYHQNEMKAFRLSENSYIQNEKQSIRGFRSAFDWLGKWIDHQVKVSFPYWSSRFGLVTWIPIVWLVFAPIIISNLLVLIQGPELGLVHRFSWPWEWDVNLYAHILLPTHRGVYRGVVLIEWIDVLWKILSSYFIYHLIMSSRRLTKF